MNNNKYVIIIVIINIYETMYHGLLFLYLQKRV